MFAYEILNLETLLKINLYQSNRMHDNNRTADGQYTSSATPSSSQKRPLVDVIKRVKYLILWLFQLRSFPY